MTPREKEKLDAFSVTDDLASLAIGPKKALPPPARVRAEEPWQLKYLTPEQLALYHLPQWSDRQRQYILDCPDQALTYYREQHPTQVIL